MKMDFEIDDVFELKNGDIHRVSGVIHGDEVVFAWVDDVEIKFNFDEIITVWGKK